MVRYRKSSLHTGHLPLEMNTGTMDPLRPSPSQAVLHFLYRSIKIPFLGYYFQDLHECSLELGIGLPERKNHQRKRGSSVGQYPSPPANIALLEWSLSLCPVLSQS